MRAYLSVFSARFCMLLQYRAAVVTDIAAEVFSGLIQVMIFAAFFAASDTPQPMTYAGVVTYVWVRQALLSLIAVTLDGDIHSLVRSGNITYELLRPLDLYTLWYTRSLAQRLAPALLHLVPVFGFAALFFDLGPPPTWAGALAWVASTLCALLLAAAVSCLLSISLLWTISGSGMEFLVIGVISVLSGAVVPLPFFPEWVQPILQALPFRGLVDLPIRLYTGHIPPAEALPVLAHQLGWVAALVLLGRWIFSRGTRRIVIQGG